MRPSCFPALLAVSIVGLVYRLGLLFEEAHRQGVWYFLGFLMLVGHLIWLFFYLRLRGQSVFLSNCFLRLFLSRCSLHVRLVASSSLYFFRIALV